MRARSWTSRRSAWKPSRRRLVAGGAVLAAGSAAAAVAFLFWPGRGSSVPAGDPFADGIVEVAVAVDPSAEGGGASAFPKALVELVSSRLASPGTRVHALPAEDWRSGARDPLSLRRQGVEQVLLVQIGRSRSDDAEGTSLSIGATVRSTADGSAWRELPAQRVGAFDIEAVDVASQHLAREYLAALTAARSSRSGPR